MIWRACATYTHICMCGSTYSTKKQVKTRLASIHVVHLIGEVVVKVAGAACPQTP